MFSIEQYIKSKVQFPDYGKLEYATSIGGQLQLDYEKQGGKMIFVQSIFLNATNTGGDGDLTDFFTTASLFHWTDLNGYTGWQPFFYLSEIPKVDLRENSSAFNFSIYYQVIYNRPTKFNGGIK